MVSWQLKLLASCIIELTTHRIFTPHRKQALQAKSEAEKEGIVVPLTLEEYCLKPKTNPNVEPQVSEH
jgi:hypothetical protein